MTRTKSRDLVGKFLVLLLAISVTLFACGPFRGARADSDAVEIWSTYATEKIMQNEYDRYEAVRFAPNVSVNACKGEYESTQLILTAKQDISNYNVQVSDLTDGAGNTFEAENILVCKFFQTKRYFQIKICFVSDGSANDLIKELFQTDRFYRLVIERKGAETIYHATLNTDKEYSSQRLGEIMAQYPFIRSIERCDES